MESQLTPFHPHQPIGATSNNCVHNHHISKGLISPKQTRVTDMQIKCKPTRGSCSFLQHLYPVISTYSWDGCAFLNIKHHSKNTFTNIRPCIMVAWPPFCNGPFAKRHHRHRCLEIVSTNAKDVVKWTQGRSSSQSLEN